MLVKRHVEVMTLIGGSVGAVGLVGGVFVGLGGGICRVLFMLMVALD